MVLPAVFYVLMRKLISWLGLRHVSIVQLAMILILLITSVSHVSLVNGLSKVEPALHALPVHLRIFHRVPSVPVVLQVPTLILPVAPNALTVNQVVTPPLLFIPLARYVPLVLL